MSKVQYKSKEKFAEFQKQFEEQITIALQNDAELKKITDEEDKKLIKTAGSIYFKNARNTLLTEAFNSVVEETEDVIQRHKKQIMTTTDLENNIFTDEEFLQEFISTTVENYTAFLINLDTPAEDLNEKITKFKSHLEKEIQTEKNHLIDQFSEKFSKIKVAINNMVKQNIPPEAILKQFQTQKSHPFIMEFVKKYIESISTSASTPKTEKKQFDFEFDLNSTTISIKIAK